MITGKFEKELIEELDKNVEEITYNGRNHKMYYNGKSPIGVLSLIDIKDLINDEDSLWVKGVKIFLNEIPGPEDGRAWGNIIRWFYHCTDFSMFSSIAEENQDKFDFDDAWDLLVSLDEKYNHKGSWTVDDIIDDVFHDECKESRHYKVKQELFLILKHIICGKYTTVK